MFDFNLIRILQKNITQLLVVIKIEAYSFFTFIK